MTSFFKDIPEIAFEGPDSRSEFAFRHYDPDEMVMGKRLEDHLRFSVAYWHSFAWPGGDPFGGQTFERPWFPATRWIWRNSRPTWRSRCSASSACRSSVSTMPMCGPMGATSRRTPIGSRR